MQEDEEEGEEEEEGEPSAAQVWQAALHKRAEEKGAMVCLLGKLDGGDEEEEEEEEDEGGPGLVAVTVTWLRMDLNTLLLHICQKGSMHTNARSCRKGPMHMNVCSCQRGLSSVDACPCSPASATCPAVYITACLHSYAAENLALIHLPTCHHADEEPTVEPHAHESTPVFTCLPAMHLPATTCLPAITC
jgi:hypothetical protein